MICFRSRFLQVVSGTALFLLLGLPVSSRAEVDPAIVEALRADRARLRDYTWNAETVVRVAGKVERETAYRVRYNHLGELEKIPTDGAKPGAPSDRARHPMILDAGEAGMELRDLIDEYLHPATDRFFAFLRQAEVTSGHGKHGELTRIHSVDYILPRDSVDIWIDTATNRMEMLEIKTNLTGNPVAVRTLYLKIPDGPPFPHRTVIFLPIRKIEVSTHNFDPVPAGGE